MRGLALLCFVGLILATLAAKNYAVPAPNEKHERALRDIWHPLINPLGFPPEPNVTELPQGSTIQVENEMGTNMTTNSSIVPVASSGHNETIHRDGTLKPDKTEGAAADGKSSTATEPKEEDKKPLLDFWHILSNVNGFPPEPTDGNVIKGKQK